MTKIKICGLKNTENAIAATEYGADFLGVVFAKNSKRYVSPKTAKVLIAVSYTHLTLPTSDLV